MKVCKECEHYRKYTKGRDAYRACKDCDGDEKQNSPSKKSMGIAREIFHDTIER